LRVGEKLWTVLSRRRHRPAARGRVRRAPPPAGHRPASSRVEAVLAVAAQRQGNRSRSRDRSPRRGADIPARPTGPDMGLDPEPGASVMGSDEHDPAEAASAPRDGRRVLDGPPCAAHAADCREDGLDIVTVDLSGRADGGAGRNGALVEPGHDPREVPSRGRDRRDAAETTAAQGPRRTPRRRASGLTVVPRDRMRR